MDHLEAAKATLTEARENVEGLERMLGRYTDEMEYAAIDTHTGPMRSGEDRCDRYRYRTSPARRALADPRLRRARSGVVRGT